jgi:hypothetical protein
MQLLSEKNSGKMSTKSRRELSIIAVIASRSSSPEVLLGKPLLSALEGNATDCAALDLAADIIEKRSRCFLTPDMARRSSQRFAASFRIDSKQFVHPRHNRSCIRVSWT